MRALRILLIFAVVLGGLFVAADRIAVSLAESEVAEKVQSSQGLSSTPGVEIKGFPFLTQVLAKKLEQVDIDLSGVEASAGGRTIQVTDMSATLRDVHLEDNFSSATADAADGSASISYEDLTKAADKNVRIGYGGKDGAGRSQVKVTASLTLPAPLDQTFERSVVSTVSVVGGDTVRLRAEEIPGDEIPGLEDRVRRRIDMDQRIGGLPDGLKLGKVVPDEQGIDLTVTGSKVRLAG